ncbi:MAG: hypothetical protein K6U88_16965 [Dehalococcoidia bacterium]|nr:hypothetical protein [Dehalococcoidia bacterium]
MIRSLDAATNRFLDHLRGLNSRLERAQREVAGGKRVAAPSDAPDRVVSLLGAKADLARLDQIQANLGRFKTEVDGAEGVLQQAVKLFDRVRTLGMTGASGIQTETTRRGIADEIQSLIERMTGIANTQVDGRYIFAGNADQTAPFLMDWSATPPWGPYRGAAATREAIHPTGVTFRVSLDAEWIFANPDPHLNVLAGMETLRQALLSGDEQAMQSALAPLADMAAQLQGAYHLTQRAIALLLLQGDAEVRALVQRQEGERAGRNASLWRIRADGSDAAEWLNAGTETYEPLLAGWVADGSALLYWMDPMYSRSLLADGGELFVLPVQGGGPLQPVGDVTAARFEIGLSAH